MHDGRCDGLYVYVVDMMVALMCSLLSWYLYGGLSSWLGQWGGLSGSCRGEGVCELLYWGINERVNSCMSGCVGV